MPTIAINLPAFLSRLFPRGISVVGPITFYPTSISDEQRADAAIIDALIRKATTLPPEGEKRLVDLVNGFPV